VSVDPRELYQAPRSFAIEVKRGEALAADDEIKQVALAFLERLRADVQAGKISERERDETIAVLHGSDLDAATIANGLHLKRAQFAGQSSG
jgi:hypothetical protein